jgi:hypothetical protein
MIPPGTPPGAPPAQPTAYPPAAAPPGAPTPIPPPAATIPGAQAANGPARPVLPGKPGPVAAQPAVPAGQRPATAPQPAPAAAPQPVPQSSEFKPEAPVAPGGRRYRRDDGKGKIVWLTVCLVLTGLLVTGAILGAKYLSENYGKDRKETDPVKLVERLGSADPAERDAAQKALHEMGKTAEAALREGAKSGNAEVARRSHDLLAALGITVPAAGGGSGPGGGKPGSSFPRRMLFVHISRYHFLNPLTAGAVDGDDRTKSAAVNLAYQWQVPYDPKDKERSQLFILSDTARPDDPKAAEAQTNPMKPVVEGAYEQFFATSRPQDHVVFYFGGHALEVGGKAYLAPIEGDLEDPEPTLIPLSHFWEKLKACKATQRVVIWDVCRYNPQRGRQRAGSEPMTPSLYKALADAPPGVEVVITCQAGENAMEFRNLPADIRSRDAFAGSAFLESMRYVGAKNPRQPGKQPTPNDPLVIADWAPAVGRRLGEMAAAAPPTQDNAETKAEKPKPFTQTLRVEGRGPAAWLAADPAEPPARRFDFPPPPKGVPHAEVASIVNEFSVPPVKADLIDADLAGLPYREEVLKDYKSDVSTAEILKDPETYKFQAATLKAFDKIRKLWALNPGAAGGPQMRDSIPAPVNDMLKKSIVDEQDFWALGVAELEGVNFDLDGVASLRDMQSKRWKANYDYACAVIKSRLAYMHEYNKVLGNVRTETLPELDIKRGQNMYKLVSAEKMKSGKEVQTIAEEAKTAYERVVTEHKGTPWALQAKREKSFRLGLAWQPISSGDPEMMK